MITISDRIIDVPTASLSGKDDIMPIYRAISSKVAFSSMISSLALELWIGTSMVLSEIIILAILQGIGTVKVSWNICFARELM